MQMLFKEADVIINGERQDQYGAPEDSFQIIAEMWCVYLRHRLKLNGFLFQFLDPKDVGIMMSLFKHARMLGQGDKRDNYKDAVGYLAIVADRMMKGTPLATKDYELCASQGSGCATNTNEPNQQPSPLPGKSFIR